MTYSKDQLNQEIDTVLRSKSAGNASLGFMVGGILSILATLSGFTNPPSKAVLITGGLASFGYGYVKSKEYENLSESAELTEARQRLTKREDVIRSVRPSAKAIETKAVPALTYASNSIPDAARMLSQMIQEYFMQFDLACDFKAFYNAPSFLRFEFVPHPGVDSDKFLKRQNDFAAKLDWAKDSMISLTPALAVDIRKPDRDYPKFADYSQFTNSQLGQDILLPAGIDIYGELRYINLSDPDTCHAQVSGSSGSGKTVYQDSTLLYLMQHYSPEHLQMALFDGQAMFAKFNGCPHLIAPVACNPLEALGLIDTLQAEADRRQQKISNARLPHTKAYNKKNPDDYIVPMLVMMDELSVFTDMEGVSKDDEEYEVKASFNAKLKNAARTWRKLGMHLVLGIQGMKADIVPKEVRDQLGVKVALRAADEYAEKIAGVPGCAQLFGKGDALIKGVVGACRPERLQTLFIDEDDVEGLIEEVQSHYRDFQTQKLEVQYNMTSPAEKKENAILDKLRSLCIESKDGYITWSHASQNLRSYSLDVTGVKQLVYRLIEHGKAEVDSKDKKFTLLVN